MDASSSFLNGVNVMPNPFIHRMELSTLERIKVAFLSVTAAPVRAFLLLATLAFTWLIAVGGLIGRYDKDLRIKPLSKLHRDFIKPLLCQMLRLMFMFGGWHWITIKGKLAPSKQAPILAIAPHSSFFDAIIMSYLCGPSIVAKADVRHAPIFGPIINYCEPIFVSRDDPNSRQNTVQEIIKRSNDPEYTGRQVAIFPEGTCTNRTCLITFKPGAFLPGVPIQPVCLRYKNKTDVVSWTFDGPSALKLIWTSLCQFHNFLEIEFLPVYVPNKQEKQDPILYANNVRNIMSKCLNVPVMNCVYTDHPIILKTLIHCYPIESHLRTAQQLRAQMKLGSPRSELSKYTEFTRTSENIVSLKKFTDYLQVSAATASSDNIKKLFSLYQSTVEEDDDSVKLMDFRDYMLDLCLLCGPVADAEPPIQLAFQTMDKTGRVELNSDQLERILLRTFDLSSSESLHIFNSMDVDKKGFVTYDDLKVFTQKKSFFYKLFVGFGDIANGSEQNKLLNESPSKAKSE